MFHGIKEKREADLNQQMCGIYFLINDQEWLLLYKPSPSKCLWVDPGDSWFRSQALCVVPFLCLPGFFSLFFLSRLCGGKVEGE